MKNKNTNITIFLLITVLISIPAVSCGHRERIEPEPSMTSAVTQAEINIIDTIEAKDYEGSQFTIATRAIDNYTRQLDDISAENMDGNILNDMIFERNSNIMDKYNLVFNIINHNGLTDLVRKSHKAGDDEYDLVLNSLNDNVVLSSEGCYTNLEELSHVDLSQKHWSRAVTDDISIFGKYYVGVSDLTIQAYFSSGIVYFNKPLAADYQLENPYTLVSYGKWTLDKMSELCRDVSNDLNGNGKWDEDDQYGITYNNFAWQIMFYGIGETFVNKNDLGELFFDSANEKIINYIQKMMPLSLDEEVTLYSENYSHLGGNYRVDVCQMAFYEGRTLFWLEAMYGVPTLREMKRDFGILPVPKYDENQNDYHSFIHTSHASSVAVPAVVSDKDRSGRILEDMTRLSGETVRDAFIETTIKGKYFRDNESEDMIDIVIGNIRTDYALLLNSSGLTIDQDMRLMMDKGSTDINSLFTAKASSYSRILETYNQRMNEIE